MDGTTLQAIDVPYNIYKLNAKDVDKTSIALQISTTQIDSNWNDAMYISGMVLFFLIFCITTWKYFNERKNNEDTV